MLPFQHKEYELADVIYVASEYIAQIVPGSRRSRLQAAAFEHSRFPERFCPPAVRKADDHGLPGLSTSAV